MNRRTIRVVGVVVVLAVASIGIQLTGPFEQREETPKFDFSESPDEIAATALVQTETTSYTVEARWNETKNGTGGSGVQSTPLVEGTYRIKYDHSDQQAFMRAPNGYRIFANPHFRWKLEPNQTAASRTDSPSGLRIGYFDANPVRKCDCVRVEANNESTLVLVIDDTQTAISVQYTPGLANNTWSDQEATLLLIIDKDDRRLQKTVFRWTRTGDNGVRYVREGTLVYSDWGETGVERPEWAGHSLEELVLDVLNYERADRSSIREI